MKCEIKNISINYEVVGEGKPIIMLHGYAADNRLMNKCMEPIFNTGDNYKRIYIDLPGMGQSKGGEWINSSDAIFDIVIEFIEKVIPNENFLLAGQSYGGYLARGVLYKMASRIDGLLLICPMIIPDMKKRKLPPHVILLQDAKVLSKLSPSDLQRFYSSSVVQNQRVCERYKEEVLSGIKVANLNLLRNIKRNGYGFSFEVDKMSERFDKPTLIVLGRQDSSVGYKDAWCILENFPRATFAVLDRAGHNLQIEQENVFNCLVSEWLTRV